MLSIFPEPILNLPEADVPLDGVKAHLFQGENYQIIFMEFEKNVDVPEHSHESQWEIVLEGKVDYYQNGVKHTYVKGDRFFVPAGTKHYAKVYAGYAAMTFFNEKERYKKKSC
ncbi:MAG: cupin domain-containing protein [Thermoplasmatales archaeon]|nr:cupin domain-containing protein [Thermoplasmatales archaeon]